MVWMGSTCFLRIIKIQLNNDILQHLCLIVAMVMYTYRVQLSNSSNKRCRHVRIKITTNRTNRTNRNYSVHQPFTNDPNHRASNRAWCFSIRINENERRSNSLNLVFDFSSFVGGLPFFQPPELLITALCWHDVSMGFFDLGKGD